MERRVVLEVVDHKPPVEADSRNDAFFDLAFDLRKVFHHGYIEVHDRAPKRGTNPFFDEYVPLLASGTDELRWERPIARGDHKTGESQKLGRIFARAYLSLHRYRWFADVKELVKRPENDWSVRRRQKGDMPDWIVGGARKFAVAEAKGTHSAVHANSTILSNAWRPQVGNVVVTRRGRTKQLKGWIVATRWVTAHQAKTLPKMYAEDPVVEGEEEVADDDREQLEVWLARIHTLRNLLRLQQHAVAQRLAAARDIRSDAMRARASKWRCIAPGFERLAFLGRPLDDPPGMGTAPWDVLWPFFAHRVDDDEWERWRSVFGAWIRGQLESTWFDGLAVQMLDPLMRDELPPTLEALHVERAPQLGLSLMPDGSLLAPMSLMEPAGNVEL